MIERQVVKCNLIAAIPMLDNPYIPYTGAPTVIRYPQRMNNVSEGSTVQLFCDAVGTTTPVISWRLNWGNVPPPPRVTMTSDDGRGVLTIR